MRNTTYDFEKEVKVNALYLSQDVEMLSLFEC